MEAIRSAFGGNKDNTDYRRLNENGRDSPVFFSGHQSAFETSMNTTTTDLLYNNDFHNVLDNIEDYKERDEPLELEDPADVQSRNQEFLKSLSELYSELVDNRKQKQDFIKLCKYLDTVATNLSKKVKSNSDKRLEIVEPLYKEDNFIIILMSLGFEMALNSKNDIVLTLESQPPKGFLNFVMETLRSRYLQPPQPVQTQIPKEKKEVINNSNTVVNNKFEPVPYEERPNPDRASFLASRHEQRLNQKYHPSSVNHQNKNQATNTNETKKKLPDNWNFQRNVVSLEAMSSTFPNGSGYGGREMNTQEQRANMNSQLNDYRQRMKNRKPEEIYVPENVKPSVFDSIKKHLKKAVGSDKDEKGKGKGGMLTGSEIEKMRIAEDQVKFGKRALDATNEFRAQNNLMPLQWNQELCDIAMQHSKNMAEGRVPFSHEGFADRVAQIRFLKWSTAENVAYNMNCSSPPDAAVRGWIQSPGHRANLLSNSNVCGIACYRSENGAWYFTQFFAMKGNYI